jgi:PhnB protein
MPKNPPDNMPRITAMIYYEDVAGALDWLTRAFGFRERLRMPGPDGSIMHAEMELADGVIMLGRPEETYRNPNRLGGVTQSLYVYVDDVDDHFQRARESGATIHSPVRPRRLSRGDAGAHAATGAAARLENGRQA